MPITFNKPNQRWHFQFNRVIAGKRYRASRLLPKGWSKKDAEDYDVAEVARLYKLASGVIKEEPLIDQAVLLYLQHHAPALKNFENLRRELHAFSEVYEGKTFAELPAIARDYPAAAVRSDSGRTDPLMPGTVRNRLAYLRAACRYAWKHHGLGDHDPGEKMVLPRVRNERQVYLGRAAFLRICREMAPGKARAAVRIAFYSGMRASEVLGAELRLVSGMHAFYLDGDITKNSAPRAVPIHPRLAHIVRNPALWPITHRKWWVSQAFKAAARAAGLPDTRLHDLRHSTASEMINGGADLYMVAGVLGHKSQASTKRYSHLTTRSLASAVQLVGKRIPTDPTREAA